MMQRCAILFFLVVMMICLAISAIAQEQTRSAAATVAASSPAAARSSDDAPAKRAAPDSTKPVEKDRSALEREWRIEGEKRFRTNCGRCHMAPHKFGPRVMATAIRHMRVRATLTEEDMRLILHYMTR